MEKAINLFEKALAENRRMSFTEALVKGNTDTSPYVDDEGMVQFGDVNTNSEKNKIRYSIKEIPKMGKVAFVDGKIIEQDEGEELNHAIRRYFDKNFKNKEVIIEDTADKTKLDQIGKYLYPGQTVENYGEKREAVTVLDEIIRISTDKKWNKNLLDENGNVKNHGGYDCTNGFNYYDTQFAVDNSGVIWGGRVVVRIDKNNNMYFYDLDNIREIGYYQDVNNINPVKYGSSTSLTEGSLSQEPPTVNTNNMQKNQNDAQGKGGRQHLLGGESSVVADNKTLAEARRMNLKGEPQAEIFKKTGWYKGIDNKWKKEIDPNDAKLFPVDNENMELYNDNHNIVPDKEKIKYGNQKETGTDFGGISTEVNRIGDKGRRSKSDRRNIPGINTEIQSDKINKKSHERWGNSSGSGKNNLGPSAFRSADKNVAGGETANGRRFQEAVKRGDTKTARKLLDEQAVKNGYSNEKVYHGTHAKEIFTVFKDGGANWVSTDYNYAERYAEEYTGKNKALAKQLFTDEEGGIFDLYIKKGKVLDVGDINLELDSMDAFKQFAEKIGFSDKEVLDCWNAGREYKADAIWALTITPEFAEIARQKGYDTLKATERNGIITYGVLYPENLKSAKIETYDDKGNLIPLEKRFDNSNNDIRYLLGAEVEAPEYNSTAKSRTRLERYENETVRKVADAMSVRLGTAREFLKPIIQEMSNEYMKTGKLSQETIDRLFEEAYKNGKIVNDEAYKEYADLRNYLRNTKIYVDKETADDIGDFFTDIRRYRGRLMVSGSDGISVDRIYQELNGMHPGLFPDSIYTSSDRMHRIMQVSDNLRKEEVTLDAYYNTDEAKGDLKHEFEKAVYEFKDHLYEVKHFNDSLEKAEVKPGVEIDADSMKSVYDELAKYQKEADKVMNRILLTKDENAILEDMLKGKRSADAKMIPEGMNKGNIMQAYEAKAPVRALQNIVENHKKAVRKNKNNTAEKMIDNSDFWKDKKVKTCTAQKRCRCFYCIQLKFVVI